MEVCLGRGFGGGAVAVSSRFGGASRDRCRWPTVNRVVAPTVTVCSRSFLLVFRAGGERFRRDEEADR